MARAQERAHARRRPRLSAWTTVRVGLTVVLLSILALATVEASTIFRTAAYASPPETANSLASFGIFERQEKFAILTTTDTTKGLSQYLHQAYRSLQQQPGLRPYLNLDSPLPGWDYRIEITDFDVQMPGLPASLDGLKIAHVTDLHIGWYIKPNDVRKMAEVIESLQPDLVVITGDLVFHQDSQEQLEEALRPLAALPARYGFYASLGNHDYWHGVHTVAEALHSTGIHLLLNDSVKIAPGFWLAGVDDLMAGHVDLDAALRHIPINGATVLLSHNPNILPSVASRSLLVLSGHSHGGQVKPPWVSSTNGHQLGAYAPLMAAFETMSFLRRGGNREGVGSWRYINGWYHDGMARMYVGRGLGLVRPPFRLNCPAELTLLRLRSPHKQSNLF